MYEIQKLDPLHLNSPTLLAYKNLIPPRLHHYLSPHIDPAFNIFLIGASKEGSPAGVTLAVNNAKKRTAEIHVLYVLPSHRHQGVGNKLFEAIEIEVKKTNCYLLFVVYETETHCTASFEHMLKKSGWVEPHPYLFDYHFQKKNFHPPWFQLTPPLRQGIEIFPFNRLVPSEKEQINQIFIEQGLDSLTYPFDNEEPAINTNSLVMRERQKIIGWMVTHKFHPDVIRYSSLFILPSYPKSYGIRLLIDSLRCQDKSGETQGYFRVNRYAIPRSWNKFINDRLYPYASEIKKSYRSWKQIG